MRISYALSTLPVQSRPVGSITVACERRGVEGLVELERHDPGGGAEMSARQAATTRSAARAPRRRPGGPGPRTTAIRHRGDAANPRCHVPMMEQRIAAHRRGATGGSPHNRAEWLRYSRPRKRRARHSPWWRGSWVRDTIEVLLIAVILYVAIAFALQTVRVDGESMVGTLQNQDLLLASKISYDFGGNPQRGDIVILIPPTDPSQDFIKRVIGLPGDVIEIDGNHNPTEVLIKPGGKGAVPGAEGALSPRAVDDAQVLLHLNRDGLVDAAAAHHPCRRVLRDGRQPQLLERFARVRAGPAQEHPRQGDPAHLAARSFRRSWRRTRRSSP